MRLFAGLLLFVVLQAQDRAPAIETIRKDELKADLFFLASDAMRGRLTGAPEYALTAEWIAARYSSTACVIGWVDMNPTSCSRSMPGRSSLWAMAS